MLETDFHQHPLVLASASPRRNYLLGELGFSFLVDPSHIDESKIPATTHREFALKAALAKAGEVASRHQNSLVIGADTVVCIDQELLGKPADRQEAHDMLMRLRGRFHTVITGVALVESGSGNAHLDAVKTKVFFKRFTRKTLERYLQSGDSLDKAGAYGIQGEGERLVHHIEKDYFNVMGLPLECLLNLLSHYGDVGEYEERLRELRRPF